MADSGGAGPVSGVAAPKTLRRVKGTTRQRQGSNSQDPERELPEDDQDRGQTPADDDAEGRKGRFIDERC